MITTSFTLFTKGSSDNIEYTVTEKIIQDILQTFLK